MPIRIIWKNKLSSEKLISTKFSSGHVWCSIFNLAAKNLEKSRKTRSDFEPNRRQFLISQESKIFKIVIQKCAMQLWQNCPDFYREFQAISIWVQKQLENFFLPTQKSNLLECSTGHLECSFDSSVKKYRSQTPKLFAHSLKNMKENIDERKYIFFNNKYSVKEFLLTIKMQFLPACRRFLLILRKIFIHSLKMIRKL